MDVTGDWTVWVGTVKKGGRFSAVCDDCKEESDCNYHGVCTSGMCVCSADDGVRIVAVNCLDLQLRR